MPTVNYLSIDERYAGVRYTLGGLGVATARGDEDEVGRIADLVVPREDAAFLHSAATAIGVTERFRDVVRTFRTPAGQTPAGFRVETALRADGLLQVDLVRDISYDRNGVRRPTGVVFSADTADPYEVAPIAPCWAT